MPHVRWRMGTVCGSCKCLLVKHKQSGRVYPAVGQMLWSIPGRGDGLVGDLKVRGLETGVPGNAPCLTNKENKAACSPVCTF